MKLNKELERFDINNECQQIFKTFIPKFKKHFSKVLFTDIKPFLNTFHSLIKDHIISCMSDEDNRKFLSKSNNYDDFMMYVLYRLFDYCSSEVTKQKLVICKVLEEAIASKLQSIEMWKNDCSVKFKIPAEENDHLTSSTKSSDFIIYGLTNRSNPYEVSTNNSTNQSVGLKVRETFKDEEVKKSKALTELSSI